MSNHNDRILAQRTAAEQDACAGDDEPRLERLTLMKNMLTYLWNKNIDLKNPDAMEEAYDHAKCMVETYRNSQPNRPPQPNNLGGAEREKSISTISFVDFQDSIANKVRRWFLERGFALANNIGIATPESDVVDHVGLLWVKSLIESNHYLFGLFKTKPRREFFGVIWLAFHHGATPDHWVFEFYGRKNVETAKQLATELASAFGVPITCKLVKDQPCYESFERPNL